MVSKHETTIRTYTVKYPDHTGGSTKEIHFEDHKKMLIWLCHQLDITIEDAVDMCLDFSCLENALESLYNKSQVGLSEKYVIIEHKDLTADTLVGLY